MVSLEDHLRGLMGIVVKGNEVWGRGPVSDGNGNQGMIYKEGKMTILLNGSPISDLSGINPKSLTGVQIVRGGMIAGNMATSLMLPSGSTSYGVVFLTMKGIPDKFIKMNRPTGFLQFTKKGFTVEQTFYSPKYDIEKVKLNADNRTQLLWKPDIITSEKGNASLDFYTSDEPGVYQATLEGVGSNGEITRKVIFFDVR